MCFVPLGHYEAERLLLSRGVDVDALNFRRVSPLQLAAGKGHDQAVKILLEHGADVSCYILLFALATLGIFQGFHLCTLYYDVQQNTWWTVDTSFFSIHCLRSGIL